MASTIKVDQIEGSTGSTITVPTGQTLTVTDGIPVASGGTGLSSFAAGDILYATGATTLVKLAKGTTEQTLKMNTGATAPEYGTANAIAGGTSQTTWAAGDLLYANGTNTLTKLTKPGSTMNLQMTSAGVPSWVAPVVGGLKQVVSTSSNAIFSSTTVDSFVSITDIKIVITPADTANKIYGTFGISYGTATADRETNFVIQRQIDGGADTYIQTSLAAGGGATFQTQTQGMRSMLDANGGMYLTLPFYDAPSTTSEVTYQLFAYATQAGTFYMNRNSTDSSSFGRGCSVMTGMEITV